MVRRNSFVKNVKGSIMEALYAVGIGALIMVLGRIIRNRGVDEKVIVEYKYITNDDFPEIGDKLYWLQGDKIMSREITAITVRITKDGYKIHLDGFNNNRRLGGYDIYGRELCYVSGNGTTSSLKIWSIGEVDLDNYYRSAEDANNARMQLLLDKMDKYADEQVA